MRQSLKTKLFLLAVVSILAVLKDVWPTMEKPGKPSDGTIIAWLPGDPHLKRHPCESQKAYLARKYGSSFLKVPEFE